MSTKTNLEERLASHRAAVEAMIQAAERAAAHWTTPRAAGKWSPSQVVEHVALSLEQGANSFAGRPTLFPRIPGPLRPVVRGLLFNRVLKNERFPKAKTNKAMDPAQGPATAQAARARLEAACKAFEDGARTLGASSETVDSSTFGRVTVADYVRFNEIHTRHHTLQIPRA